MTSADTPATAAQPDFTPTQLESVTQTLFPGWSVSSATAPSAGDSSVSAVAYAQEAAALQRVAAIYLYRTKEGRDAPGESLLRTNWKGLLEVEYGIPYDWATCGNLLFLVPEDLLGAVQSRLTDIGC